MPPSNLSDRKTDFRIWLVAVLALVCAAYANHFHNDFHFDDSHTISSNPWIRDLGNIPRFFTDPSTFSTLPANRAYRPLLSVSLAVDYWLGGGLKPLWFHVSTFIWFLVQLGLMFGLFRYLLERATPKDEWNDGIALVATALYGVHPVMAETVNYIIQRGDLYAALGVVGSLYWYLARPEQRRFGFYLVPLVAAILSKPPAMVMPLLLIAALCFLDGERFGSALKKALPSLLTAGLAAWFMAAMTPKNYSGGAANPFGYRITQPAVLLHYFQSFFAPTGLTADTDRASYSSIFEGDALVGFLFVAVLVAVIAACGRQRATGPLAFGLSWFLITSIPTSVFPLAEVENDHRMFLPFVGLALCMVWGGAQLVRRWNIRRDVALVLCGVLVGGFAYATRERNKVWRTEETLWLDVTVKSPKNGRGLMNYGLTQMAIGNYPVALDYFQRALVLTPTYAVLETNLGIVTGEMGRTAEAEAHFARSVQLTPTEMTSRYFYARWLRKVGRLPEAIQHLRTGIEGNPDYLDARYLIMQAYADMGDSEGVAAAAKDTLSRFPGDTVAMNWLAKAPNVRAAALPPVPAAGTPPVRNEAIYIEQSLAFFRLGKYEDCVRTAQEAVKLKPGSAPAWNNIGACYNGMKAWEKAIPALENAIRYQPDFQLAKNNLAWAKDELAKQKK